MPQRAAHVAHDARLLAAGIGERVAVLEVRVDRLADVEAAVDRLEQAAAVDAGVQAARDARWQRVERARNVALWVLTCANLALAIGFAVARAF
jgi:alpha-D-ribose 1-methylphosphonate 5-triphosphate diphosphatase PhnM